MTQVHRPRLVIAGTGSGVGKTTLTLGLLAAFTRRDHQVQGFKVGPDYIDPSYHTAVTGRPSRNLDTWMISPDRMVETFLRGSEEADLSIIEGVMGMYDGKNPLSDEGSTADIAMRLESPVVLVVNIHSMARSAAAVVLGYQHLQPRVRIAGVILNRAGSEGHYQLAKAAIEQECGVPVVGWLGRDETLSIPERHLGLIPAMERGELDSLFGRLADAVEKTVDLDSLEKLASQAPALEKPAFSLFSARSHKGNAPVIAVARDAAFNFYYPENLELLEHYGAKLQFFRPLEGEAVPEEADGLMIGGGFPEEFVKELAGDTAVKESFRQRMGEGLPTYAECGGYMYLCEEIVTGEGEAFPMVGVIPARVRMQKRLAALGYREVRALSDTVLLKKGETARGHEFHYSTLFWNEADPAHAYEVKGRRGKKKEGVVAGNLLAGYTHLHFASNPSMAERWVETCRQYHVTRCNQIR
ncbi:cobyrinate a,c-diamide synthase [Marinithermofilum abyssi]|uniref:Cobyrinate a,c-diamide synthase n=1 Tax=Marinithermofilum abyssi TaxID=1571185 RepID=A0A8J2VH24_9BACL|nr:cobyrinate a,c-diamide synthase [Marinithermofilum abyssi]GGE13280.1 cobyrinate a,c-diamide synthase [Marinithermofilum abyssi]